MTIDELAKRIGVSKSTIHAWENNLNSIRDRYLAPLSEALMTTPSYLLGMEDDLFDIDNLMPIPQTKKVPLLGVIACGEPILATENIEKWVEVDAENVEVDFALRCRGNSMVNARIFDGDIVFIRQQDDVADGEVAAVLIGDEATLKRVYHYKDRLELRPENPVFPVMNFEGADIERVKILGKAVIFQSWVH
jgi:repressor LexA